MVASASYRVVNVRNKEAAALIPSTQFIEECKVPENTLWIQCQGTVKLVETQRDILNFFRHCDHHHSGIYGIFILAVIVGVVSGVPRWQNNIKGRECDCGYRDVVKAGARYVNNNAGVYLCVEVVAKSGSI